MPWCEDCAKYFTPNSVKSDGSCPTCGDTIQLPDGHDDGHDAAEVDESSPWHFKLLVFMVVAYLGWRVVDLFI
ncbi:MAG: hypothetical protein AB8G14_15490 [Ilumatobacter sp.]